MKKVTNKYKTKNSNKKLLQYDRKRNVLFYQLPRDTIDVSVVF